MVHDFKVSTDDNPLKHDAYYAKADGVLKAIADSLDADIAKVEISANGITKVFSIAEGETHISSINASLLSDLGFENGATGAISVKVTDLAGNDSTTEYNVHVQGKAAAPGQIDFGSVHLNNGYFNSKATTVFDSLQFNLDQKDIDASGVEFGLKDGAMTHLMAYISKDGVAQSPISIAVDSVSGKAGANYADIFGDAIKNLGDGQFNIQYYASKDGINPDVLIGSQNFVQDKVVHDFKVSAADNPLTNGAFYVKADGVLKAITDSLDTDIATVQLSANGKTLTFGDGHTPLSSINANVLNDLGFKQNDTSLISATVTDLAGNTSTTSYNIHVQAQAAQPNQINVNLANIIGSINDVLAVVQGNQLDEYSHLKSNPFSYVQFELKDLGGTSLGIYSTFKDDNLNGQYTFNASDSLTALQSKIAGLGTGTYSLYANVSNDGSHWHQVGMNSANSMSMQFSIDKTVLSATIDSQYLNNNGTPSNPSDDYYLISNTKTLSGTFDSNDFSLLSLKIGATVINQDQLTISGNTWSVSNFDLKFPSLIADQKYTLDITTKDNSGNTITNSFQVLEHFKTVSAPVITYASTATVNGQETVGVIKGSGDANSVVQFYTLNSDNTKNILQEVNVGADGKWELTPSATAAGSYYINAKGINEPTTTHSLVYIGSKNADTVTINETSNAVAYGFTGADTINGGSGNDWIFGGLNNDTIRGGAGSDNISGGAGNDIIYGDDGNDIIYGDDGDDTIYAGNGNDILYGGAGKDTLVGGSNNDVYAYKLISDSTATSMDTIQGLGMNATNGFDNIDLRDLIKSSGITPSNAHLINNSEIKSPQGSTLTADVGTFWLNGSTLYGNVTADNSPAADVAIHLTNASNADFTDSAALLAYLHSHLIFT